MAAGVLLLPTSPRATTAFHHEPSPEQVPSLGPMNEPGGRAGLKGYKRNYQYVSVRIIMLL
jgi:hypothetical protein